MARTYNVIDADGHVLEPVDIWDKYIDPAYRDRAPRMIIDTDGKERLLVEGKVLGSQKGFGVVGAIGARQGAVADDTMKYVEGRPGGFDPHARIPDMDLDGIDAAFLYPSVGLFAGAVKDPGARRRDVPRLQPLARRLLPALSRSALRRGHAADAVDRRSPSRRCASRATSSACAAGFLRPNPYNGRMLHHPDYDAVLGRGAGARLRHRPARGRQRRHAAGRRRPLRDARRAAHHLAHHGDDAGGA